jgi:predicted transcriptional regulator
MATTKLERAIKEAELLPDEVRENLGDDLLHYIHKYLALRDDLEEGLRELDAGQGLDGREVFARLKAKYGA